MTQGPERITTPLKAWSGGDEQALERLTPLVYPELRRIARRYMRRENTGNTLQATALVHEAYLRLVDANISEWQDRAHFFAVCAQIMRRVLVSAARTRGAEKRGGGLSARETAQVLKTSEQTVLRDWKLARSWLARQMEPPASPAR